MPKSKKKKKDKAADFSKAKLKLGKGKQLANNAVDTSFKARSIALPSQSIAHDKDTEAPSTRRRLTFGDLTAHLKHYNAGTRKDAILGLKELLEAHPELIDLHLTALINSSVRLIGDEDASVRKTLLFFLTWLFRQIPSEDLIPHSPVLLLFTTSAQTHIFPEIRIDAIRFLDIFLEHIPDVVVDGWTQGSGRHGRRILEGYLGILNAGTSFGEGGDSGPAQATSTASVVLSPASKLVVLKSLSSFLTHALSSLVGATGPSVSSTSSSSTPTWYLSSSFSSPEAFEHFDAALRSIHDPTAQLVLRQTAASAPTYQWTEKVDGNVYDENFSGSFEFATAPIGAGWSLQDLTNVIITPGDADDIQAGGGVSSETEHVAHLSRTLHSTLVSTLLDCAPTFFAPSSSPPETELQMMLVLCEICRSLYGAILRQSVGARKAHDKDVEDLQLVLGYLSPYFPFTIGGSSIVKRDIKLEQAFQDLNLVFCELTSFLLLASSDAPTRKRVVKSRSRQFPPLSSNAASLQVDRVSEYVVLLLQGEAPSGPAQASLSRPITAAAYTALLPTIWALINSPSPGGASSTVLQAVAEHAVKVSSTSAVKRHTVDFLGRLILLERDAEYRGAFRAGRHAEEDRRLEEWVLQLPKTLWELGATNLPATETILRFLLRLCQRRSPLLRHEVLASLRARLIPYFVIAHATRGKLPGPYAKLPPASRMRCLVLDVVFTVIQLAEVGEGALAASMDDAVEGTVEATYWMSLRSA